MYLFEVGKTVKSMSDKSIFKIIDRHWLNNNEICYVLKSITDEHKAPIATTEIEILNNYYEVEKKDEIDKKEVVYVATRYYTTSYDRKLISEKLSEEWGTTVRVLPKDMSV